MMKRRSRDIETETEEELLLLVFPAHAHGPDHSSGSLSLSSSVSLSDKSVSTDNNLVEEYVSDVPFAGESTFRMLSVQATFQRMPLHPPEEWGSFFGLRCQGSRGLPSSFRL